MNQTSNKLRTIMNFIFLSIIGLNYANASLHAITKNTIQGIPPKITDSSSNEIDKSNKLAFVEVEGKTYVYEDENKAIYLDGNNNASVDTINASSKLSDISANVSIDEKIRGIPEFQLVDKDSDGTLSLYSNITKTWLDSDGKKIDENKLETTTLCSGNGDYKLQLTSSDVKLITEYGDPDKSKSYPLDVTFKFKCSTPLPKYPSFLEPVDTRREGGSDWTKGKGFQYGSGFPTTGLTGLVFYMNFDESIDAKSLKWSSNLEKGRGITVTPKVNNSKVQVTLSDNNNPRKVILPTTITIQGKDSNSNVVASYTFTLKKWFHLGQIAKEGNFYQDNNKSCTQIGYSLPSLVDFNNSSGLKQLDERSDNSDRNAKRQIGSLVTEWGDVANRYSDTKIGSSYYYGDAPFYRIGVKNGNDEGVGMVIDITKDGGANYAKYGNGYSSGALCVLPTNKW